MEKYVSRAQSRARRSQRRKNGLAKKKTVLFTLIARTRAKNTPTWEMKDSISCMIVTRHAGPSKPLLFRDRHRIPAQLWRCSKEEETVCLGKKRHDDYINQERGTIPEEERAANLEGYVKKRSLWQSKKREAGYHPVKIRLDSTFQKKERRHPLGATGK